MILALHGPAPRMGDVVCSAFICVLKAVVICTSGVGASIRGILGDERRAVELSGAVAFGREWSERPALFWREDCSLVSLTLSPAL